VKKIQFSLNRTSIEGTLREDRNIFLIVSRSLLRMSNVSDKFCTENRDAHFIFNIYFILFYFFKYLRL